MSKVLIGSRAVKHWRPDFYREPKDWDWLTNEIDFQVSRSCEMHPATSDYPGNCYLFDHAVCDVVPLDLLYTLKVSHAFWDVKWPKTMHDIEWMQNNCAPAFCREAYDLLYKDWERIHGKKRAYLKEKNEEFFKSTVKRVYDHDSIHRALAYSSIPMFERIKTDQSQAMVSKGLFEALPQEDQFRTVREEAYVTAIERYGIPTDFRMPQKMAYTSALKLLITSMCKGWFPLFMVLHWNRLRFTDIDFYAKFQENKVKCKLLTK